MADGVGGWRSYGVDPSLFPQSLMAVCERLVREGHFVSQQPVNILSSSYQEIQQDKVPLIGNEPLSDKFDGTLKAEISCERLQLFLHIQENLKMP